MAREYFKYFKNKKKILDIGPGIGLFMSCSSKKIIGVDINSKAIKHLKLKGYTVIKSSAEKLPFKNDSFDGVMCSHLIEHLNPDGATNLLGEINRVLKKEGILVLRFPHYRNAKQFYSHIGHVKPYFPQSIKMFLEQHKNSEIGTERDINVNLEIKKIIFDFNFPNIIFKFYNFINNFNFVNDKVINTKKIKDKNYEYKQSKSNIIFFEISHFLAKLPYLRSGYSLIIIKK